MSGVEFLETAPKFRKRTKTPRCVFTSSVKRVIRKFHVLVVQMTAKKCAKKCNARAEFRVQSIDPTGGHVVQHVISKRLYSFSNSEAC